MSSGWKYAAGDTNANKKYENIENNLKIPNLSLYQRNYIQKVVKSKVLTTPFKCIVQLKFLTSLNI